MDGSWLFVLYVNVQRKSAFRYFRSNGLNPVVEWHIRLGEFVSMVQLGATPRKYVSHLPRQVIFNLCGSAVQPAQPDTVML